MDITIDSMRTEQVQALENEIQTLEEAPMAAVQNRLHELDASIDVCDEHAAADRDMLEHLQKLREGIEREPYAWVEYRKNELEERYNTIDLALER